MMPLLVLVYVLQASPASSVPCVSATSSESRSVLEAAGIKRICADNGQAGGASRETLPAPGVAPRPGVASPTRSPWIVANGWRFMREPGKKFAYEVSVAKAGLAAVEAYAYGADAVVKVDLADSKDLATVGTVLSFLESLPPADLPGIADLAVVDDGSALTGEVMNLLARRNLLFEIVKAPSASFPINIAVGSAAYPAEEAADPSAFALKVRRQLTDDRRTLRVFGSEVVICRLTGDATRTRLHVINYGGREIEGLRIRLRGTFRDGEANIAGAGRVSLQDYSVADGATEFSLPRLTTYAVIDLKVAR
jgi:hypothetical protein